MRISDWSSDVCSSDLKTFQAIELGYSEASRAIFDANVTNVIAAALMFWFGTGPIKGFAVVLTIGIATSVFTAVTVTRLFAARWLHAKRPTHITLSEKGRETLRLMKLVPEDKKTDFFCVRQLTYAASFHP